MPSFGDNVRCLRTRAGITQAELAGLVSLRGPHHPTQTYISMLESGQRDPRLYVIRSLARALGVKPWVLVAGLSDNTEFWEGYLLLSPQDKREIQRRIAWMLERGK